MAVGIYKLPICDGCKLPWLPVGWTQDSDPRNTVKPLRCGKCKSIGWDREFVKLGKEMDAEASKRLSNLANGTDEIVAEAAVVVAKAIGVPIQKVRCKHRMTDCPICHPKEAA